MIEKTWNHTGNQKKFHIYRGNHRTVHSGFKRECIADLPFLWDALNSISNLRKVMRAKFQGSDRLFCFISISKIGNFKNPFAMITSLPQLLFGSSRFILLVRTKEVISVSYSSSTNLRTCCCRRVEVAWGGVAYGQGDVWCKTGW